MRPRTSVSARPLREPEGGEDFYVVVPSYKNLSEEERESVDAGGAYPLRRFTHLPRHETFLDFLIERGLAAWTRSQG